MGLCLFVADAVANVGLGALVRQIIPLFFVELIVLIIISFFPIAVIGLPRVFGF
jgi:TRAP-type C4-dicarboxylate transport system permease large subunit